MNNLNGLMEDAIKAHSKNDFLSAKALYLQILRLDPNAMGAAINLSAILLKEEESSVVDLLLPFASENAPCELWFNLGLGYKKQNILENAQIAFENALVLNPQMHQAKYELGRVVGGEQGALMLSEALKLNPKNEDYWIEFAKALEEQGMPIEAANALISALGAGVTSSRMLIQIGLICFGLNKLDEAEEAFQNALTLDENNPEIIWQLSLIRLKKKNFKDGWNGLWVRFDPKKDGHIDFPILNQPVWDGRKTDSLLIVGEQGFGDNIQFARFIKQVSQLANKVYFAPRKELISLFKASKRISDFCTVIDIHNLPKFDTWIPIMELAGIFDANENNIPFADWFLLDNIQKEKENKLKVGIVWQGNPAISRLDKVRSISLREFSPLFEDKNIEFYALQQGYGREQLDNFKSIIRDIGAKDSFLDTAKEIEKLDVVISVDSSVAHLSAGMGKKTFVVLPFSSCWRWSTDEQESYWYHSAKLFRQQSQNDWNNVVKRIKEELSALA